MKSSQQRVFGGYSSTSWSEDGTNVNDLDAFLFSVTDQKIYRYSEGRYGSLYHFEQDGPSFVDMVFQYDFSRSRNCKESLGEYFGKDEGVKPGDLCCKGDDSAHKWWK